MGKRPGIILLLTLILNICAGCAEDDTIGEASFDFFRDYNGFSNSLYNLTVYKGSPYYGITQKKYKTELITTVKQDGEEDSSSSSYTITTVDYNPDGTIATETVQNSSGDKISWLEYTYSATDNTYTAKGNNGTTDFTEEGNLNNKKLISQKVVRYAGSSSSGDYGNSNSSTSEENSSSSNDNEGSNSSAVNESSISSDTNESSSTSTVTKGSARSETDESPSSYIEVKYEYKYDDWNLKELTYTDNDLDKFTYTYKFNDIAPKIYIYSENGEDLTKTEFEVKGGKVRRKVVFVLAITDASTGETTVLEEPVCTEIYEYEYEGNNVSEVTYYTVDQVEKIQVPVSKNRFTWSAGFITKVEFFSYLGTSEEVTTESENENEQETETDSNGYVWLKQNKYTTYTYENGRILLEERVSIVSSTVNQTNTAVDTGISETVTSTKQTITTTRIKYEYTTN